MLRVLDLLSRPGKPATVFGTGLTFHYIMEQNHNGAVPQQSRRKIGELV
jgi:hypothetical protein